MTRFLVFVLMALPAMLQAQTLEISPEPSLTFSSAISSSSTPKPPFVAPVSPADAILPASTPFAKTPSAPIQPTIQPPIQQAPESIAGAPATPEPPAPSPQLTSELASKAMNVDLAIIDKNLGRKQRLQVPMGRAVTYKTLEIMPQRCVIDSAAEPLPSQSLLVEIYDRASGKLPSLLFSGWMLVGDPSLSHLEHPYYDVVVFGCSPIVKNSSPGDAADENDTQAR